MPNQPHNRHWQHFYDFCRYERLTGGPDPHMKAVINICHGHQNIEKIWRSFLYVGVYNVPTAEAIWTEFSGQSYILHPERVHAWVEDHWDGIQLRRERRTVKSPERLAQYLQNFPRIVDEMYQHTDDDFEELWRWVMSFSHVGRYAATKACEIWYKLDLVKAFCRDIRPSGGWSPRQALMYLYPDEPHLDGVDTDKHIQWANDRAMEVMIWLRQDKEFLLSWFELEVMLCEYKASYSTKRQYPGRSLDSELKYELAKQHHFGASNTEHMRARRVLSPKWALGELQGWYAPRDELGKVVSEYGYTWSDSLYDFKETRDFSAPVRKDGT